ncbi:MAG TPA: 2Fe-2S iron-sulfur cluster-binding protein [Acidimicrobiales bacterium]|nr:2Fe-2S iron-sulfur cluster-binding protein [Acidimicrobiales bacterium]
MTAVRRVAGRHVVTSDGLDSAVAGPLLDAVAASGGSQCGFCTPGILCRLASLGPDPSPAKVQSALLAHLCRCTGWRGLLAAAERGEAPPARRSDAGDRRAAIEGGTPQLTGPDAASGRGGFADDLAPLDALVAVPDGAGGWAVGETVADARRSAGKVQGRRSGHPASWPLELPPGDWDLTLRTTWVEPAYLEPDASWCAPGGEPASPLGNGGAFGGKLDSAAPAAARMLADRYGRPVRVVYSREDVVRLGPKRPPVAAGVTADGRGVLRAVRTPGLAAAVAAVAPGLTVQEVDVAGPATSTHLRAAGWAEAAVLLAGLDARTAAASTPGQGEATITSPAAGRATATVEVGPDGLPAAVDVAVACGDPLDEVVLRSYVTGAAHMALGWVLTEFLAVDADGQPEDLTIRSWGILRAKDTPPIHVTLTDPDGPPVNGSDAAFAAVAAATWIAQGLPPDWPTRPGAYR